MYESQGYGQFQPAVDDAHIGYGVAEGIEYRDALDMGGVLHDVRVAANHHVGAFVDKESCPSLLGCTMRELVFDTPVGDCDDEVCALLFRPLEGIVYFGLLKVVDGRPFGVGAEIVAVCAVYDRQIDSVPGEHQRVIEVTLALVDGATGVADAETFRESVIYAESPVQTFAAFIQNVVVCRQEHVASAVVRHIVCDVFGAGEGRVAAVWRAGKREFHIGDENIGLAHMTGNIFEEQLVVAWELLGVHHHVAYECDRNGVGLLKMASAIQFTLPGVPSIYYGDEAGMQGYKDPFNRCCFPWGNENGELAEWYRRLGKVRTENGVFADGKLEILSAVAGCVAYSRKSGGDAILVIANSNVHPITYYVKEEWSDAEDLLGNSFVRGTLVDVDAKSTVILKRM